MNLAMLARRAGTGALAGALAGFALAQLGFAPILGNAANNTLITSALVGGAVIAAGGGLPVLIALDALSLLAFLIIAYTPLMGKLAPPWVRADPVPANADAIIVLSGTLESDSAISADALERLLTGMELYHRGVSRRMVTTRVQEEYPNGTPTSDSSQARLLRLVGADSNWSIVLFAHTTRGEAVGSAGLLKPPLTRPVVVVTSPLSTRRACAAFEVEGFAVSCQPAREYNHVTWHPITSRDHLASFREYLYERLGMVKYRWEGWVR